MKNFWQREHYTCDVDVTIDTLQEQKDRAITNSILLNRAEAEHLKLRILLEASDKNEWCFPDRVQVDLKPKDILRLYAKTLYYSVGQLFCILLSICAVIK